MSAEDPREVFACRETHRMNGPCLDPYCRICYDEDGEIRSDVGSARRASENKEGGKYESESTKERE